VIFFTADTHFGDPHILRQRRQFETIEAHDALVIERWNARIGPDDEVWHVGDFSANASRELCQAVFARLAGRKRLVRGNHDTNRVLELPWDRPPVESARFALRQDDREVALFLSHYPHRSWPGVWRGSRHLYGHTHAKLPDTTRSCDVGVDAWDFWPVTLEEALARQAAAASPPEELVGREDRWT
jgi:calcineurin-like phosphoesterase family protein